MGTAEILQKHAVRTILICLESAAHWQHAGTSYCSYTSHILLRYLSGFF